MPIPIILGIGAALVGAAGVGAAAYGAKKMYDAKETNEAAQSIYKRSIKKVEKQQKKTYEIMDEVGKLELTILSSFDDFSDIIEKIQNRPEFKAIKKGDVEIPVYSAEELNSAAVGAAVLLGGLSGAGLGAAGGIAASGATTAAVMAFGTASTGAAISGLSGVAATNATLAFLGGGSLAAGGGGIALGTTLLGASMLGVGLLVGGAIFALAGSKMEDKADAAYSQACEVRDEAEGIYKRLTTIEEAGTKFKSVLEQVNSMYEGYFTRLSNLVNVDGKVNFDEYSEDEINLYEIATGLVSILYRMCKVQLTKVDEDDENMKMVNQEAIDSCYEETESSLSNILGCPVQIS